MQQNMTLNHYKFIVRFSNALRIGNPLALDMFEKRFMESVPFSAWYKFRYKTKHNKAPKKVLNKNTNLRRLYGQNQDKQKIKYLSRRITKMHIKDGDLKRLDCEICGEPNTHIHHNNYLDPKNITFLCKKHHYEFHHKYEPGLLDYTQVMLAQ